MRVRLCTILHGMSGDDILLLEPVLAYESGLCMYFMLPQAMRAGPLITSLHVMRDLGTLRKLACMSSEVSAAAQVELNLFLYG